jgi:predicted small secreted protein
MSRLLMETMMRFKILLPLLAVMCMGMAGCANTVHGAGEDISNAGHVVKKGAASADQKIQSTVGNGQSKSK